MSSSENTKSGQASSPPPTPASLTKVPKPDKAAHEAEINSIQAEIKTLQDRSQAIRNEIDALQSGRSGFGEQIQSEKAVYAEIRSEKDKLIQQRSEINARLRVAQGKRDENMKSQKALRSEIKYTSADEIEKQISLLRHRQETQSMSLAEEKKVIKEIEFLQQSRKKVQKYATEQGEMQKQFESIKDIRSALDKKNAEIDKVSERLLAQKKILDELYAANNSSDKDQFPKLIEERKQIKAKLDEKFGSIRSLRSEFKEANDKYYNFVRALREAKKEERRQEELRRQAEYEAKLAEYESEMAKLHPYQDEMDLCDALLKYLQSTYAKELSESSKSSADSNTQGSCCHSVNLDGMKPLKREEENFMMLGKGKGKKGGKKKNKGKEKSSIALPLAQLESFSTIGLLPPSNASDLKESVKAIKEKKEFFSVQTSREKAEDAPKNSEPVQQQKPKKKPTKFDAEGSDFPSLTTSVGTMSLKGSWGTSANLNNTPSESSDGVLVDAPTPAEAAEVSS